MASTLSRERSGTATSLATEGGTGRGVLVAAVAAVALVIGTVVGRGLSSAHRTSGAAPRAATVAAGNPGPRSVDANVPVGYARTQAGAVAAGTTYLATASERLVALDPAARQVAVARMLAPDAGSGVADNMLSPLAMIDTARQKGHVTNGRALVRMLPLAYKVNAYAPDRAQIAVWSAGVFTIEGLTAPTEAWSTTTVDLVWSAGDWRLYSIASTPGPVPAAPQAPVTSASQLLDSIDGFSSYRYVAAS